MIHRILATTAVWSIASVVTMRLRHPMVGLTLGALAAYLTFLIWTPRHPKLPYDSNGGSN